MVTKSDSSSSYCLCDQGVHTDSYIDSSVDINQECSHEVLILFYPMFIGYKISSIYSTIITIAPLCSVMRTMRPQSVRNSHTFVPAMKTTNGKCCTRTRGHKDNVITRNTNPMPKPRTDAGSAVGYDATSPLAALPLLTFLRQPDSIFCLCICVPSAQNFRILLALLVVSLSFCPSLSLPPLSTSLLHALFHSRSAISFNALRIYRKMQYALPSLSLAPFLAFSD